MDLIDRASTAVARRPREIERSSREVSMEEFAAALALGPGRYTGARAHSGVLVTDRTLMGSTAWYRGVRFVASAVSGLPWHQYMRLPDDARERRSAPPWLARPDAEQTWRGLVEYFIVALLNKGNGFAFKLRNEAGQVFGLREIHPDRVTTGIAPDGTKRFLVDHLPHEYTTREIFHVPGFVDDASRFGCNPIRTLANAMGIVLGGDEYAGRFYSASNLGGIISYPGPPLDGDEAERVRVEWEAFHDGLANAHKTGVLSGGATYNRIALSAEEAQLLQARTFGITEVARAIGIAPHKLYELSRATFSNIEHQSIEVATDTVRPHVHYIEDAVNHDPDLVLPGFFVEAAMEGLMRGDSAAIAASLSAGVNGGWLSPYTAARIQNLPAPDELDYYLRPLNMAVIRPGQPVDDSPDQGGAAA